MACLGISRRGALAVGIARSRVGVSPCHCLAEPWRESVPGSPMAARRRPRPVLLGPCSRTPARVATWSRTRASSVVVRVATALNDVKL